MCYDDKARPPVPDGQPLATEGKDLTLTGADGNRFLAYVAQPVEHQARAQVLIYPDVRGLHGFYKALADRFAEQGITALAIDYFGRTAGTGDRGDSFEFMPHVQQMEINGFYSDVTAALAHLQSGERAGTPTFVLGFCMGGTLTIMTGTQQFRLAGLVPFYSGFTRKFSGSNHTALEMAGDVHYPLLGLYGGADKGITPEQLQELDDQLTIAGVEHEIVVYDGAPHSFFDRAATEYAEASADAWRRVLAFIRGHAEA